jgi:hypothetical protein
MPDTAGLGASRSESFPFEDDVAIIFRYAIPNYAGLPVRPSEILATTTTRDNYNRIMTIGSDTSTLFAQTQSQLGKQRVSQR